jgi:dihydrofolate reductase
MKLVVNEFIALDGVVQAPGGKKEDTDGGFRHGGWSMRFFDPEVMGSTWDSMTNDTDAILQGRRTWQVMAGAWPARAGDRFADWINSVQKYVVSDTLSAEDLTWKPTTIIRGADLLRKFLRCAISRAAISAWRAAHPSCARCSRPTSSTSSSS